MQRVHAVSLFPSIPAGALDEFRRLLAELLAISQGEAGTLAWEWFFSADATQCAVHETFADSAAVLAHIDNSGDRGGRLAELAGGMRLEVLGDLSEDLRVTLAGWGAAVFSYGGGKHIA